MAKATLIDSGTGYTDGTILAMPTSFINFEGVEDKRNGDFAVTENGSPNDTVQIAQGVAWVQNLNWTKNTITPKFFPVWSTDVGSVTISANLSGQPRIDLICLKIDNAGTPGVQGADVVSFVAIEGTPAASPSRPSIPTDASYIELAQVAVSAGFSTITDANITDTRTQAGLLLRNGATLQAHNSSGTAKTAITMTTSDVLEIGESGVELSIPAMNWQTWTPTWTNLTVGNGTVNAKYSVVNKTVYFWLQFTLGSTSSIGAGVSVGFPYGTCALPTLTTSIGTVRITDTGTAGYVGIMLRSGSVANSMAPNYMKVTGSLVDTGSITATTPMTWTTGDQLTFHGWYPID